MAVSMTEKAVASPAGGPFTTSVRAPAVAAGAASGGEASTAPQITSAPGPAPPPELVASVMPQWGEGVPRKQVSGKAMERLGLATDAIVHTKEVLSFGAGNQHDALVAGNFNSFFRVKCMDAPECWEMSPAVENIAYTNPEAWIAAKADLAKGGNCNEHSEIAFDYLNVTAKGQRINRCANAKLNHGFVILGDMRSEPDAELVVCDPWPTSATACLWEDHFAFNVDRTVIDISHQRFADGESAKNVIKAGLRLSSVGMQRVAQTLIPAETERLLNEGTQDRKNNPHWIEKQADAFAKGKKFDYRE